MGKAVVTSSGSGIGVVYQDQPMLSISDTLFVFDLYADSLAYLKTLCSKTKWNSINIYQLQVYRDLDEFDQTLRKLIQYGIFDNQDLCNSLKVTTTDSKFTTVVNNVWPQEQKSITKFKGRKWPDESLVKEFTTKNGEGSVSVSRDKLDLSDIVSWGFELNPGEDLTMDYSAPLVDGKIPIPLEDEAYIEYGDDTTGEVTEPTAFYYYKHEYIDMPIYESHATPANNLTMSFIIPQNSIHIDIIHMHHVTVLSPASSGGE